MNLRGEYPASLGSHKYVPFHLGAPLAAEGEKKPLSRAVFVLPWMESTETSEGPRCFCSLLCCKEGVTALLGRLLRESVCWTQLGKGFPSDKHVARVSENASLSCFFASGDLVMVALALTEECWSCSWFLSVRQTSQGIVCFFQVLLCSHSLAPVLCVCHQQKL